MRKIISISDTARISEDLKKRGKSIVLTGGCFDILHAGHIKFLNSAKEHADLLFLLLESDENIKKIKGNDRPLNSRKNRSIVLSALSSVDYVITLSDVTKNEDYDKLIVQIQPDYIAVTKGDKNIDKRQTQCKMVGAKLIEVEKLEGISSTDFIKNIK